MLLVIYAHLDTLAALMELVSDLSLVPLGSLIHTSAPVFMSVGWLVESRIRARADTWVKSPVSFAAPWPLSLRRGACIIYVLLLSLWRLCLPNPHQSPGFMDVELELKQFFPNRNIKVNWLPTLCADSLDITFYSRWILSMLTVVMIENTAVISKIRA